MIKSISFFSCLLAFWAINFFTSPKIAQVAENSLTNSIGMEFVLLPSGSFQMGSKDPDAKAFANERPQHQVVISKSFYLAKYEVSQGQWEAVMGSNPYSLKRTNSSWESMIAVPGRFIHNDKPATVSWNDAQDFIKQLNQIEGHHRYRLPTEAEWEYAARARSSTSYFFGDDIDGLSKFAWYGEDFVTGSTHPVGQKAANSWGLHDIYGNVWEWVHDRYGDNYYQSSSQVDPVGPQDGTTRVVRGGSWHQTATDWRSSFRRDYPPDYRGISIGFRLALSLEEQP